MIDEDGLMPSDAPPAWETETADARRVRLHAKARELPPVPGVYIMKDKGGVVLYVGKAARLPDRVGSYFVPSADPGPKKKAMLPLIHDFDSLIFDGEWEALLAENRLIKDIRPRFNERLIDDKTFPYLAITLREEFPRVFVTRNPADPDLKGAKIFGPFAAAGALREAVQLLQRVFKFRTCHIDIVDGDPKNRFFRPCLLYSIGQCTAPCADKITKLSYREDVDRFTRFLGSKRSAMMREMRQEMMDAASAREYERAAALRDQINAIEKLDERASRSDGWQPETELSYVDPEKATRSLQRTLEMDTPIRCIEGIDIAHLAGGETVGSKVCFVDGKPFKNEYRRYRIRSVDGGNDDYASIPRGRQPSIQRSRCRQRAIPGRDPHRRRPRTTPRGAGGVRATEHQTADGHQPRQERRADLRAAACRADPARARPPRAAPLPAGP